MCSVCGVTEKCHIFFDECFVSDSAKSNPFTVIYHEFMTRKDISEQFFHALDALHVADTRWQRFRIKFVEASIAPHVFIHFDNERA